MFGDYRQRHKHAHDFAHDDVEHLAQMQMQIPFREGRSAWHNCVVNGNQEFI